jgi:orotate phosphoribosyltransferase-like protein
VIFFGAQIMQQQSHNDSEQSLSLSEELLGLIMHYFTTVIPKNILDDHVSSGTTISEVACSLRKNANLKQEIVPFTIASIKWKLGQSGMV